MVLRWQREIQKARKSEAVVAEVDNFDLSGLSEAASRIENAISWNDADKQTNENADDKDEYYEEDVDWYTGDCDDELDVTAYTVGTPTGDPVLLEQFDGNLEDADASASQVYAPASRSFQEARKLLSRVKSVRGYFPVVGICAFDGLARRSTDRKGVKSRGKGKKGKREGKSSSQKGGKPTNLGTPNHRPHVSSLVLRCPRSVRLRLAQPVVDHIMLLVFVLVSACCVDKLDIVHQHVPTKEKRLHSYLANVHLILVLWVVQCSMPLCYGATVEENEQDQDENDIEDFVAFSIKSLEEVAILDGGATKTVSGFMSIQQKRMNTRTPRLIRQMLALRSLAAKRFWQERKSVHHTLSFPQGISVNVVSNESTLFSSAWTRYASTGCSSTTTAIVSTVTS